MYRLAPQSPTKESFAHNDTSISSSPTADDSPPFTSQDSTMHGPSASMPEIRVTGSSPRATPARTAFSPEPVRYTKRYTRPHSTTTLIEGFSMISGKTESSDFLQPARRSSRSNPHLSSLSVVSNADSFNTQTVGSRFNIMPSNELLLYLDELEDDDDMHDPMKKDTKSDLWSGRSIMNFCGIMLILVGIFGTFLLYPILAYFLHRARPPVDLCASDPMCIKTRNPIPHVRNVRTTLIDPDTPSDAKYRMSSLGKRQKLVFSDEFNQDGRTFYEGDDPFWQAVDIWYGVTQDIEWYDPDAITTANGTLNIRFDHFPNHGLDYRSGMLQSWNKMCFKGGHLEASISLPGQGDVVGFWPGFWAMGNLGRPGYAASTDGLWPYTYHDKCDLGITPNQSQPDGTSFLPGMRLPACTCKNEDHPSPGRSRGAPEIDALEASVEIQNGRAIGTVSQSLQVAPFDVFWQPDYNFVEVYNRSVTEMNSYQGGPYQEAISGLTNLNNRWYNGKEYQRYGFEYKPGDDGHVTWYVGPQKTWKLDPRSIGANGNVGKRVIPVEPMSVILNFGMSHGFAQLDLEGLKALMPATMRVDYVRIYQDEGSELVTCDPPGYPTTEYIRKHPEPYSNANLTEWSGTSYKWPKNSFMHSCK